MAQLLFRCAHRKVTNGPAKVDLKIFKVETHDGKICVGVPARDGKSS